MTPVLACLPTICGLNELDCHSARGVTHILSILDPGWPEPEAFATYGPRRRATLHFHDEIEPKSHLSLPRPDHIEAILAFGRSLAEDAGSGEKVQLLVHCHMGISRSTAAVAALLAQMHPEEPEDRIFVRLLDIRPQAWPNCLMISFADELLRRAGRLTTALGKLYAMQLVNKPEMGRYMRENGRGREVDMATG
jgi:predicted protein tyrosine phosphatase